MKMILIMFIMMVMMTTFISAQLTIDEKNRLINIEKLVGEIGTSISKPTMSVFGTEYQVGDEGRLFLQLLDSDFSPINDATCRATIYYPNITKLFDDEPMLYVPESNGLFYVDVTAPNTIGIYMTEAECLYLTNFSTYNVSSYELFNGTLLGGNLSSLFLSDDDRLRISEWGGDYWIQWNATEYIAFPMNEGTGNFTVDVSGTFNDLVFYNNTNWTTGYFGYGITMDGSNDYALINATSDEMYIVENEQFLACVTYNTTQATQYLWTVATDSDIFITLELQAQGKARAEVKRGGTSAILQDATGTDDGQWHTACVYSDANLGHSWLYVDGLTVDSSGVNDKDEMNITHIHVGSDNDFNTVWTGELDEFCIWRGFGMPSGVNDEMQDELVAEYEENRCNNTGMAGQPDVLTFNVTFNNITLPEDITEIRITTEHQWDGSIENVELYIYNFTSASFDKLNNDLTYSLSDTTVVNSVLSGFSDYINSNTTIIRVIDSNSSEGLPDILRLDNIKVEVYNAVSTPVLEVRGSQELHITDRQFGKLQTIAQDVWNYNGTISNNILSQFVNNIWNYTGTIVNNILTQFSDTTWTRTDRNLTFYPPASVNTTEVSQGVWNYSERTLTDMQELWVGGTEYSEIEETGKVVVRMLSPSGDPVTDATCTLSVFYPNNTVFIDELPMTEATNLTLNVTVKHDGIYFADFNLSHTAGVYPYAIDCDHLGQDYFILDTYHVFENPVNQTAEAIWNYATRNLTYFPAPPTPNNLTAGDIWNYATRNLTFYETVNLTLSNDSAFAIATAVWNYSGTAGDNILNQIADRTQCYLNELLSGDDGEWGIDISAC